MLAEVWGHRLDDSGELGAARDSVAGVVGRVGQYLGQMPCAVLLEDRQPRLDGRGYRCSEGSGSGDLGDPHGGECLDGGAPGCGPLSHNDFGPASIGGRDEGHQVAPPGR